MLLYHTAGCRAREHQVVVAATPAAAAAANAAAAASAAAAAATSAEAADTGRQHELVEFGTDDDPLQQAALLQLRSPQRALQLLERFGGLVTVPYQQPQLPLERLESGGSSSGKAPEGDEEVASAGMKGAAALENDRGGSCPASASHQQPLLSQLLQGKKRETPTPFEPKAAGAAGRSARAGEVPGLPLAATSIKGIIQQSAEAADGTDDDDGCAAGGDFRSAHLASFMQAVREAARARHRMLGADDDGAADGAAGAAVLGALGAGFSTGGRFSLTNTPRQGVGAAASKGGGGAAAKQRSGDKPGTSSTPARAAVATRTVLLELMREDDAFRMELLMRHLDRVRLQPTPDGASTARS